MELVALLAVVASVAAPGAAMVPDTGNAPDSKVLDGVPRVGYDRRFCTFGGCVEAVMTYRGRPVDYDYVMGVSGLAFRRLWNKDDGGNVGPLHFAPECVRRTFWALGYGHRIVPYRAGRAAMLGALKASLAHNRPVLSSGIVGPPECEIVCGYGRGGDVLRGWSYFQEDPSRCYAQPDWFERANWANGVGLVVIGDEKRGGPPSRREVLHSTLKWAIVVQRAASWPGVADHSSGLAAYDEWAKALEADADYPGDDPKVMGVRCMVQADQAVMTEERSSAARFLRTMADAAPEAADLLNAAAGLYQQVAEEAGPVYPWGGDQGPAAQKRLSEPAVRREIARHVRAARGAELKAVILLERAVATMDAAHRR